MQKLRLNSIDDYESYLGETLRAWSPEQRTVLAAAIAERWLPTYEAFSAAEDWGDSASLRRTLDAVWSHASGRLLSKADLSRYKIQLQDSTPHMDDFDAPAALATCVILSYALDCCSSPDNLSSTILAALSGFEAAVTDWVFDPEDQPRLWKQIAARKELRKQLDLLEQIGRMTHFDEVAIKELRKKCSSSDFIGETAPLAKDSTGPVTITNQQAFEQYRRMVESDLRTQRPLHLPGVSYALLCMGVWSGRYSRRRQTIDGSYGQLADTTAQQALVRRQQALDAVEKEIPAWNSEDRWIIELSFSNPASVYDAKSPYEPHRYGPSMRRLWIKAKRLGRSDEEAWDDIVAWARHRPAAWDVEDRRKKKGHAHPSPAIGEYLARNLTWTAKDDVEYPWETEINGQTWRIHLNDFPDDFMYALLVDDIELGSFHDWPENWKRG